MNSNNPTTIHCPYCGALLTVERPSTTQERPNKVVCTTCHKPIALYSSEARALRHQDHSVRSVAVSESNEEGIFLEFVETQFNYPQNLQIPYGESIFGRYNPNSPATLQLDSTDMSLDRQHLRLRLSSMGVLTIRDNASLTGTFVNGTLLQPNEWRRLNAGDVIAMGATTAIAHLPEEEEFWD